MLDLSKPEKRYYKIGELAKEFGVKTSLIRFWEKHFDEFNPKKNAKGDRMFTHEDIKCFKTIYHLVKEKGMTLDGAKEVLSSKGRKTIENQQMIMRLEYIKKTLLEIRNHL